MNPNFSFGGHDHHQAAQTTILTSRFGKCAVLCSHVRALKDLDE